MKILMPVLVAALFFGLPVAAKADIICGVSSTPVFRGTATGLTEPIGEVSFNCNGTAGPGTTEAIFTLEFGVPITNDEFYPAAGGLGFGPIRITNDTNQFTGLVSIIDVDNANGVITISLPEIAVPDLVDPSAFTVTGVLVALDGSGLENGGKLDVVVSSTPGDRYGIIAQQDEATVIRNVEYGLDSVVTTDTASVLTDGTPVDPTFSVDITEAYIDMFRSVEQFGEDGQTEATNSTELRVTLDGIPAGMTLGGCSVTPTSGAAALSSASFTSASNTAWIEFTTNIDGAVVDTVTLTCTTIVADSAPRTGEVDVCVTLAPLGDAFGPGTTVLTGVDDGQIPRYSERSLCADDSVLDFGDAETTLLIPFAMSLGAIDTGISIANTSNQPAAIDDVRPGVSALAGPVQYWFFNRDEDGDGVVPAPGYYMTGPGSPGTGLDPDGLVAAGSSHTVNLSELLAAAGEPEDFVGYIIAVTGFTQAHGGAFVVDWGGATNFTSATPVLIIDGEGLDH